MKAAMHVKRGLICYVSTEEDQTFGMSIPVNEEWNHNFQDGTKFYAREPEPKWIKFDINDKTTWPPDGEDVLVAGEGSFRSIDEFSHKSFNWYGFIHPHYCKYWQPVPKLQKE